MIPNVAILLFGVLLAVFHRPIGEVATKSDHVLENYWRQNGLPFSMRLTAETAASIFFCLGIFLCLATSFKIWIGM